MTARLLQKRFFWVLLGAASGFAKAQELVPTGPMRHSRYSHTATLLGDGRVLAVGGTRSSPDAELFDPATGTWRSIGGLAVNRSYHSAIRLEDGRVLIACGGTQAGDAKAVEIFDPKTETFAIVGDTLSLCHSAVKLADGRILMAATSSADIYNPKTGSFLRLPGIEAGIPIPLPDGRLVTIGDGSALVYQVNENSLQPMLRHDLGGIVYNRQAVLMANGNILIAGGGSSLGFSAVASAIVYNPTRGTATPTGNLPTAHYLYGMVALPDGTVLTRGGYADYYFEDFDHDNAIYDPATGRFTVQWLPTARVPVAMPDGRILFVGSDGYGRTPFSQLYDPTPRVVSAAGLLDRVAPGGLATLFGARFGSDPRVEVTDSFNQVRSARLLYTSPSQINFEVPGDLRPGPLKVVLPRPGLSAARVDVEGAVVAPGLFTFENARAAGYAERKEAKGASTILSVREPLPLGAGPLTLTLYGSGIRNRTSVGNVVADIGGILVGADYAGPDGGGAPGLDQVNVSMPDALRGRGIVDVRLFVDGVESNTVTIEVQ